MYQKTFHLNDNEIAAKINIETGEIIEAKTRVNNIPEGKEIHSSNSPFTKSYDNAWNYLIDKLTPIELKIVQRMILMTRLNSNSLAPLNNDSTTIELAETFGIHRNHVKKIFSNLYIHGVYAEFNICANKKEIKYWILNPYISYRGKIIDKSLVDLFRKTDIAKLCI